MTKKVVYLTTPAPQAQHRMIEQVLAEHGPALRRFLRTRLALESDREDVTQDVFLRLSAVEGLEGKLTDDFKSTQSYLFSIANNLIRDRQRRARVRQVEQHEPFDDNQSHQITPTPEEIAVTRQEIDRMQQAFNALGPRCRHTFVLSRFQHMSYRQIAAELGITASMVEKHISRALIALRESMTGTGGES